MEAGKPAALMQGRHDDDGGSDSGGSRTDHEQRRNC